MKTDREKRRDALDALDDLVRFALESPRFCVDNPLSAKNPHRLADRVRDEINRLAAMEEQPHGIASWQARCHDAEDRLCRVRAVLDVVLDERDSLRELIEQQSDRLAAIEWQVLWRTEDMPDSAVGWYKGKSGFPTFVYHFETGMLGPVAPDFRPDEPGPLFLPILDPYDRG